MGYDIGMGSCAGLEDGLVLVKLDSVMVKKLSPGQPWRKSGTSLLRMDRKLCSTTRPPQVNQEVYIDSTALTHKSLATLDLDGNGISLKVDLRVILDGLDPLPAPSPQKKGSSSGSRSKAGART